MKKLILLALLFISVYTSAQIPGYTTINSRYEWLAGKFRALNIPFGCGYPSLQTGQYQGSSAIYLDTCFTGGRGRLYYKQAGTWQAVMDSTTVAGLIAAGGGSVDLSGIRDSIAVLYDTAFAHNNRIIDLDTRKLNKADSTAMSDYATQYDLTQVIGGKFGKEDSVLAENRLLRLNNHDFQIFGQGKLKVDSLGIVEKSVFAIPDSLMKLGHSWIAGIPGPTYPDSIIANRSAAYLGLTLQNLGLGGSGIWNAAKEANTNLWPGHTKVTSVMGEINDLRRAGQNPKTGRKIVNSLKSIVASHFLNEYLPGGSTSSANMSITRSGSWTNTYASSTVGGRSVGNGTYSNTSGNYIECTFTISEANPAFAVFWIPGDGSGTNYNFATPTITIDGVSQTGDWSQINQIDGISDGVNDNRRGSSVWFFGGLANGSHTIRITNDATNFLVIDGFGLLKKPTAATPMMVWDNPYLDVTGYAASPNLSSVAVTNWGKAKVDSLFGTFPFNAGYPIYRIATNSYFDTLTGLHTDHIHPNNVGSRQLLNALIAGYNPPSAKADNGTILYTASGLYTGINGQTKRILVDGDAADVGNSYIKNQTTQQTSANANIDGYFKSGTVTIGNSTGSYNDNAHVLGTVSGIPFHSRYKSTAPTNNKLWSDYTTDSSWKFRITSDDGLSSESVFMESVRSGTTGLKTKFNWPVAIGTAANNSSALLDVFSTTKGVLIPRMNTTQQNAISSPATGLMIINTDSATICIYNGSAWRKVSAGGTVDQSANYTWTGTHSFSNDITVPAETYGSGWNGSNEAPTKNDTYDKIEALNATVSALDNFYYKNVGTGDSTTYLDADTLKFKTFTTTNGFTIVPSTNELQLGIPTTASPTFRSQTINGNGSTSQGISITGSYAGPLISTNATNSAASTGSPMSLFNYSGSITKASTSTHSRLVGSEFNIFSVTGTGSTVTDAATVRIEGAPSTTTTNTPTALWVDAGRTRLDGDLALGTATGGSSTDSVLIMEDGVVKSINSTSFGGGGGSAVDPIIKVYQDLGSQIKAATVGVNYQAEASFQSAYSLTDGRVQYVAVYLPTAATITGVGFYMRTQGSYTADNTNQVGLFTYSGGTMTKVAESTNNGNLWKATANTWVKEPFSSTYSASAGTYFIGFVYNSSAQTTAPAISTGRSENQSNENTMDFTNSATIAGRKTGTALPSSQTMSGLDAATPERPYVFIY